MSLRKSSLWLLRRVAIPLAALALLVGLILPHLWAEYHLREAARELDLGHNSAASIHLRKTLSVHPRDGKALLLSARVARRSGAWSDADAFLDRYWRDYGDDEELAFEQMLFRASKGETGSHLPLLDRINRGGREAQLAREAIVTGLLYRYRWAEAQRNLEDWLKETPDDISALHLFGQLQEQQGHASLAVLTFRKAVELDPHHVEVRLRLATQLLLLRQGEEALIHLDHLRRELPDNPEIMVQWGIACAMQGRNADARAGFEECLRLDPEYPKALAERGKLAMADGDDGLAERYLSRSVENDPGDLETRKLLAQLLLRNGKTKDAATQEETIRNLERDYGKIAELSRGPLQSRPTDPSIPNEIGLIAWRSGQRRDALRWFDNALQIDSYYIPTHEALAAAYHEIGSPALAAKHRALAQKGRPHRKN